MDLDPVIELLKPMTFASQKRLAQIFAAADTPTFALIVIDLISALTPVDLEDRQRAFDRFLDYAERMLKDLGVPVKPTDLFVNDIPNEVRNNA